MLGEVMLAVAACQRELRAKQRKADTARELAQLNVTLRALRARRLTDTEPDLRAMLAEPESALPGVSAGHSVPRVRLGAAAPRRRAHPRAAELSRVRRELLRVRGHIALPRCLPSLAFRCLSYFASKTT